ncbi:MAG: hypothetical protein WBE38_21765 [Terracidiphilus sp.]
MNTRLGALLLLAIAASTIPSWASTLPPSCGDENTVLDVTAHKNGVVTTVPEAGMAKVYFIENADKDALPVTTRVGIDGMWVGANKGSSYFGYTVPPGEHHVCVDWLLDRRYIKDAPQFDLFTAEAGKVYYFEVRVEWKPHEYAPGKLSPGGDMDLELRPVNEDQGKYMVFSSKLSTSTQKK